MMLHPRFVRYIQGAAMMGALFLCGWVDGPGGAL